MNFDEVAASQLKHRKHTIAVVEASTGGLVSAALLGVSGASKYFLGSMVVYSNQGAKAQLPMEVRQQLGSPRENYSSHTSYRQSKVVFTRVCAQYMRERLGADWGLAESGAVEVHGLPVHLRGEIGEDGKGVVFTVVSIAGPGGLLVSKTFEASGSLGRKEVMNQFTARALEFLAETVQAAPPSRL